MRGPLNDFTKKTVIDLQVTYSPIFDQFKEDLRIISRLKQLKYFKKKGEKGDKQKNLKKLCNKMISLHLSHMPLPTLE